MEYRVTSARMMTEVGRALACCYRLVTLRGCVGVGKTTLVSGLVQGRGYIGEVRSPTYSLVNYYGDAIVHCDMDRLVSLDEMIARGICDAINAAVFCVIEHPKRITHYATDADWLHLTLLFDNETRIVQGLPDSFSIDDGCSGLYSPIVRQDPGI